MKFPGKCCSLKTDNNSAIEVWTIACLKEMSSQYNSLSHRRKYSFHIMLTYWSEFNEINFFLHAFTTEPISIGYLSISCPSFLNIPGEVGTLLRQAHQQGQPITEQFIFLMSAHWKMNVLRVHGHSHSATVSPNVTLFSSKNQWASTIAAEEIAYSTETCECKGIPSFIFIFIWLNR